MKRQTSNGSQKSIPLLRRENTSHSQEFLKGSSVPARVSSSSQRRTLLVTKIKSYSRSLTKNSAKMPYQNFVRQMRIKLPTPKEKFYEFLKIPPFNRVQNHNQLIAFFLKNVHFFKIHQSFLIVNLAKKVRLVQLYELQQNMMVIVLQGECCYMGNVYSSGRLINRQTLKPSQVSTDQNCKLLSISWHEYRSFISAFVHQQILQFKDFIHSIQTLKIFSDKTLQKFSQNLTLHYFLKGQKLFKVGEQANFLFVVYSGKVSRKVIIQIQKVNKIPTQKFQRLVRILNKSYLHQIQFFKEDMVGVSEIIDNVSIRKEEIDVDQDSILLAIPRNIIEQNMDDYILDRFKKYNLKKYPANYDELCQNYLKSKNQMRKMEERKILALQNELKNQQTSKRRQKIQSIIRFYEQNVRGTDNKNLINRKLHYQIDRNI